MRCLLAGVLLSGMAWAQAGDNPHLTSSRAFFQMAKTNVLKSADKMPEDKFGFRPSDDVRTYGQVLAHIADAQYTLCGMVREGKPVRKGIEKSATTKADIVKALNEAFAYCDAAYDGLTDSSSAAMVSWFGQPRTKLTVLDFNITHTYEHYGNLVTYMRINHIVPPSSEPKK